MPARRLCKRYVPHALISAWPFIRSSPPRCILPHCSFAQLLLAPPLAARISSIFFTRFWNSSYWHFSYECLSVCATSSAADLPFPIDIFPQGASTRADGLSYLTLPWQIVFLEPTPVQRDEQMGAAITVGEGESGGGHFFTGSSPYNTNGPSDDCLLFA